MSNVNSGFNSELQVSEPIKLQDATISTVDMVEQARTKPPPSAAQKLEDITVQTVHLDAGDVVDFRTDQHVFGLGPTVKSVTPASIEGASMRDVHWDPNTVGYQAPFLRMEAAMLVPTTATFVTVPDRLFNGAAFETIDMSTIEPRWTPNMGDPVLASLIRTMSMASANTNAHDWPMLSEAIGTAMAVRVAQQLGATYRVADVPHTKGLPKDTLQRVLDYIESNIGEQMRLTELAGVALLSPFHFARSFQKVMNISPVRYIWKRRIERAKEALATKAALVAIAYDCGFSSQAHFTTSFKQATGVTPAVFRAALLSYLLAGLADAVELVDFAIFPW